MKNRLHGVHTKAPAFSRAPKRNAAAILSSEEILRIKMRAAEQDLMDFELRHASDFPEVCKVIRIIRETLHQRIARGSR